jgi:hypothetical protein
MPPNVSDPIAAPSARAPAPEALGWLATATRHARSIRRLIGQGESGWSGQDPLSSKTRRKSRRPVWE